jgi:hypothetical protein
VWFVVAARLARLRSWRKGKLQKYLLRQQETEQAGRRLNGPPVLEVLPCRLAGQTSKEPKNPLSKSLTPTSA